MLEANGESLQHELNYLQITKESHKAVLRHGDEGDQVVKPILVERMTCNLEGM